MTASAHPGSAAAGTFISQNQVCSSSRDMFTFPVLTPCSPFASMVSPRLPDWQPPPDRRRIPRCCSRARYRARQTPPYCSHTRLFCPYHNDAAHSEPKATAALDADDSSTPTCWGIRHLEGALESRTANTFTYVRICCSLPFGYLLLLWVKY